LLTPKSTKKKNARPTGMGMQRQRPQRKIKIFSVFRLLFGVLFSVLLDRAPNPWLDGGWRIYFSLKKSLLTSLQRHVITRSQRHKLISDASAPNYIPVILHNAYFNKQNIRILFVETYKNSKF